jgi:hypothetical protein
MIHRLMWPTLAVFTMLTVLACMSCTKQHAAVQSTALNIPAPNPSAKVVFKLNSGEHAAVTYDQSLPEGWPPGLMPPAGSMMAEGRATNAGLTCCAEVDAAKLSQFFVDECTRLELEPRPEDMQVKTGTMKYIRFTYRGQNMSIFIFPQGAGLRLDPEGDTQPWVRFMLTTAFAKK